MTSTEGHGSVFHFTLNFGLPADAAPIVMPGASDLHGTRALIVDDNATAREIFRGMLDGLGAEALSAASGEDALALLKAEAEAGRAFDVVLLDWKMPEMDGVACAQRIHALALDKQPALLLVTSAGIGDVVAVGATGGADAVTGVCTGEGNLIRSCLIKPVTRLSLLGTLSAALGKTHMSFEVERPVRMATQAAPVQLSGRRILVVEDNEMNQELVVELLKMAGFAVVVANNGQEAVNVLSADTRFDGVLMDCQMPVMDGYEATALILKMPACKTIPVIAMTANVLPEDRQRADAAGMCDLIAKPIQVNEMYATLQKWMPANVAPQKAASQPLPPADLGFQIPGIDQTAGLATSAGSTVLYQRLLDRFALTLEDFFSDFKRAQSEGDTKTAARLAHTLKGVAGNVGAQGISTTATKLETACVDGMDPVRVEVACEALAVQLIPVLDALKSRQNVASAASVAPVESVGREQLEQGLAALRTLVSEQDTEALDLLNTLLPQIVGLPIEPSLKKISRLLESYNFEAALSELDSILVK